VAEKKKDTKAEAQENAKGEQLKKRA